MSEQQKIEEKIREITDKAANTPIICDILLDNDQLALLQQLNIFCVNQVLFDVETARDPRKIMYKANQEMKIALMAVCLARSLTNHRSKQKYNKEFFEKNINITTESDGCKKISFGEFDENEVEKAITDEIIYDWMIYRDYEGRGISALINEKTFSCGLDDYHQGGDPVYEFARFQRKYFEHKHRKELSGRESAQETFRNTIVQQAAVEIAKQQLLAGQNPIELVNLLFDTSNYDQAIQKMLTPSNPREKILKIENQSDKKKK